MVDASTSKAKSTRMTSPKRSTKKVRFATEVTFIEPVQDSSSTSSMSGSDSPLLCLETLLEDRHSDSLFSSGTESDEDLASSQAILRGQKAKKTFQVKFGGLH